MAQGIDWLPEADDETTFGADENQEHLLGHRPSRSGRCDWPAQSPARDITPPQAATLSIRGRVLAAGTDAPLRSARVLATAANQAAAPAFTDAEGRFVFSIPADGSSRLSVTKPGYLATVFAAPRTEAALDLRLPKASAIAGRITDTSGDPVIGMTVTAEIPGTTESGRRVVASCQTDDLGDYRLGGLEGRYPSA